MGYYSVLKFADAMIKRTSEGFLYVGMAAAVLMAVAGFLDFVGGTFLGRPFLGILELTEVLLVVVVFTGISAAQQYNQHIAVTFSASLGSKFSLFSAILAQLLSFCFFGFIAWRGFLAAAESIAIREFTQGAIAFPIYPMKIVLFMGATVACLQCVRILVLTIYAAASENALKDSIK